ncbi:MAG: hypothetical protein PHG24_00280 [Candidatus Pacebacteria bacterium]|nr:hypothetical protein [Candidatus Paceibacterota bacterium]
MSTLWTIILIVVILAVMFWLIFSQNKEEEGEVKEIEKDTEDK